MHAKVLKPSTLMLPVAFALLLGGASAQRTVLAQSVPAPKDSSRVAAAGKAGQARKGNREAGGRAVVREAVAALERVAEEAREFDDLYESVKLQADAADALWPFDARAARAILRRAWEAVTAPNAADKVEGFGIKEDPLADALETVGIARRAVLAAAVKHDARLAEVFMQELERESDSASNASGGGSAAASTRDARRRLSAAANERLSLGFRLLNEGEFARAAEVVAPLAGGGVPPGHLINFISGLRTRAPREADALYLRLLEATRADASADANDVLALSAPVVSPGLYVILDESGAPSFVTLQRSGARADPPPLPTAVRRAFYETAAAVLLRLPAPRGDGAGQGADAGALYFALGRLLPFFEREAQQHAPQLHARMEALAAELDPARRSSLAASMDVNSLSPKSPVDPLASELGAAKSVSNPSLRNTLMLAAVLSAARRGLWDRARGIAAEIEDAETQRGAMLVISIRQVMDTARSFDDDKSDDCEHAAAFVRAADVPPEVRATGFAQAAELAARHGKRVRAAELLAEAVGYAEQAEQGGGHRVTALALVTLSATRAGAGRVWELLPTLVRAANDVDELRFGALNFEFHVGSPKDGIPVFVPEAAFGLPEVFAASARLDLARTLVEVRSLEDDVLRAEATLAAARAALAKGLRAQAAGAP